MSNLFLELKRRNVFKVAVAYLVVGWLLVQIMAAITPMLDLPLWAGRVVLVFLAIGFPISVLFAWAFEMTPDGVKRTKDVAHTESQTHHTGKKINAIIMASLVLALGYFIWESRFDDGGVEIVADAEASIAALPFSNLADDGGNGFVDGLHDDLLTQLSKIPDLKVISRTSVLEYRDTTKNMKQIGEELGVNTLLEGSVQRAGNRIRINVQLIDAETDEHIWAETYNRELTMDNIFEVQSEITQTIATALRVAMSDDVKVEIASAPTQNLDIYSTYLEIKNINKNLTSELGAELIEGLEEIVAIDPNFALAYAELGYRYMDKYWFDGRKTEYRDKALVAMQKALELEPNLLEAKIAMAYYHYWGWLNYPAALDVINEMGVVANNNYEMQEVKGYILRRSGDVDGAVEALERAYSLNPRSVEVSTALAQTYAIMGEFEKAGRMYDHYDRLAMSSGDTSRESFRYRDIAEFLGDTDYFRNKVIDKNTSVPNFYIFFKLNALIDIGEYDEAQAFMDGMYDEGETETQFGEPISLYKGITTYYKSGVDAAKPYFLDAISHLEAKLLPDPRNRFYLTTLMASYSFLGDEEKTWQIFARKENIVIADNDIYSLAGVENHRAGINAMFGQYDEAIDALHIYLKMPTSGSLKSATSAPFYNELKNYPRFQELVDAYGLTPKGAEALYPIDSPKYRPQEGAL